MLYYKAGINYICEHFEYLPPTFSLYLRTELFLFPFILMKCVVLNQNDIIKCVVDFLICFLLPVKLSRGLIKMLTSLQSSSCLTCNGTDFQIFPRCIYSSRFGIYPAITLSQYFIHRRDLVICRNKSFIHKCAHNHRC